ncbi:hypothetical protein FQZ97_966710 [compost metagenome]
MADQDQLAEARVGVEQMAPGHRIVDITFDAEVALFRGRRAAGGDAALVVAQAGDALGGKGLGQALEAVVAAAERVVAVAVGGPGAGDQQHHRQRFGAFRQQQGAVQDAAAGIQRHRPLQHGEGAGAGQAGEQGKAQEDHSQHDGDFGWRHALERLRRIRFVG